MISALFVYVSLAGKDGVLKDQGPAVVIIVGLVGIAICLLCVALLYFKLRLPA